MNIRTAFWLTLVAGGLSPAGADAKPVIIANPENASTADIDRIRRIYLGKERTLDGQKPVQPVDVDTDSPARAAFVSIVLEKSEAELRQYWSRLVFAGKATPPRNVGSDADVRSWVARNKDAIGCIDSSLVDPSVKVLAPVN